MPSKIIIFICFVVGAFVFSNKLYAFDNFDENKNATVTEGHILLDWSSKKEEISYSVEISRDITFSDKRVVYTGSEKKTFLSGLPSGTHFVRIGTMEKTFLGPMFTR